MKLTSNMIILIGCVGVLGFLIITQQISNEIFFILGIIILVMLLMTVQTDRPITYDQAREIALKQLKLLQKQKVIRDGEIMLMAETELKNILVKTRDPEVRPFRWEVAGIIESNVVDAYLVFLSEFGKILGTTKINFPTNYRVVDTPNIIEVEGEYIVSDEMRKTRDESEKTVKQKEYDENE